MFFEQKNETKLYDTLNVLKGCSDSDIKKSYKKLAMQYHPDRNKEEGAEEKFKEISRAYSVLGKKEKRETYDQYGEEGLNNNMSEAPNMDPFGMFGNLFNMNNHSRPKTRTRDRHEVIEISLEDIYKEKTMKLNYDKRIVCGGCAGSGVKDRTKTKRCKTCKGEGKIMRIVQLAPGFISQSQSICNICSGSGKMNADDNICEECYGEKTIHSRNNLKIHLKKKFKDGHTITFSGESDQNPDADIYGDLIVKLNIKPHHTFTIFKHKHLIIEKKINLVEALCGCTFTIKHLDERILLINHSNIIQPFSKKIIKGEGLNGDLIIHFNIIFPEYIDEERKTYIRELFKKYDTPNTIKEEKYHIKYKLDEFNGDNVTNTDEIQQESDENVECVHQ
jgi:DnaJ-class molecular chaperone